MAAAGFLVVNPTGRVLACCIFKRAQHSCSSNGNAQNQLNPRTCDGPGSPRPLFFFLPGGVTAAAATAAPAATAAASAASAAAAAAAAAAPIPAAPFLAWPRPRLAGASSAAASAAAGCCDDAFAAAAARGMLDCEVVLAKRCASHTDVRRFAAGRAPGGAGRRARRERRHRRAMGRCSSLQLIIHCQDPSTQAPEL